MTHSLAPSGSESDAWRRGHDPSVECQRHHDGSWKEVGRVPRRAIHRGMLPDRRSWHRAVHHVAPTFNNALRAPCGPRTLGRCGPFGFDRFFWTPFRTGVGAREIILTASRGEVADDPSIRAARYGFEVQASWTHPVHRARTRVHSTQGDGNGWRVADRHEHDHRRARLRLEPARRAGAGPTCVHLLTVPGPDRAATSAGRLPERDRLTCLHPSGL